MLVIKGKNSINLMPVIKNELQSTLRRVIDALFIPLSRDPQKTRD